MAWQLQLNLHRALRLLRWLLLLLLLLLLVMLLLLRLLLLRLLLLRLLLLRLLLLRLLLLRLLLLRLLLLLPVVQRGVYVWLRNRHKVGSKVLEGTADSRGPGEGIRLQGQWVPSAFPAPRITLHNPASLLPSWACS